MRLPNARIWLPCTFLLLLSACAGNVPKPRHVSQPKAPAAALLVPCRPLVPDADDSAAAALAADTENAERYLECQALELGLLRYVQQLIDAGQLAPLPSH